MGITLTTNFGYKKQDEGDANWGTVLNENFDLIDADLAAEHESDGTHATITPANVRVQAGGEVHIKMNAPTGVSASATSGGTLTAGTYYYRVTALDGSGETVGSSEVSATVDGVNTNAVQISWSVVPGASSYRVYGRNSGAQDQYWATTSTSYTDDGTAGTAGTVPSSTTAYVVKVDEGDLRIGSASTLTIAAGAVTVSQHVHAVDTEGGAASDDLDTINGGQGGDLLLLRAADASRTVVLKHNTGNILLAGSDVSLDNTDQFVLLYYDAALAKWLLVGTSPGAGEANTASNVGVGGVGLFKQKSGVDLQFKNINAGSARVVVTDDTLNDEVDIDVSEANLDHGSIGGLADDDHTQYLLANGARAGATAQAQDFGSNGVKADTIAESTLDVGVTVDGVLIKDGTVDGVDVSDYLTGEIFLTAAGGWPSTTSGCATPTKVEFATNDVDLYLADFDAAADEYIQWTVVMPFNWDGGTVTAKFYWLANDATTDSVVWGIQGRAYGDGESVDQAWGTAQTVTDANGGTANQLRISAATPAVTLAGTPAAGELVQFRAFRDADNASDTLAVDARLVGVLITYTRSS